MAAIPIEIAKNEAQGLVNFVKKEATYLCCFNNYVEQFDQKKERLTARLQDVTEEIEKGHGVSRIKNEAQQWAEEAAKVIDIDSKKKGKCFFGFCINCWWQYWRGKELEVKTLQIDQILGRCNFDIAAGPAKVLGIKYRTLPNFMHFESRKSKLQDLKDALEDENCNMIGLYGLGGTGKTSMAIQVGAELEGSKFNKVIFLVVSKPPDFKKLRVEIARRLELKLEDGEKEEQLEKIFSKITSMKEKLLIILDDVWGVLDLKENLGIPPQNLHKGCSVLITTRISHVCIEMECQREIHLETLDNKEALTLFLTHASINDSSSLKGVAQNIVKHCHGVPVVIVAVARTLKGRPPKVWKDALKTLQNAESILDASNDLKKVFEGLKLSYDNLENEISKELFLISSIFPEDSEMSLQFFSRIGVGLITFGEADNYNERRSTVSDAIEELRNSSLWLNFEEESVKMHDLVREVGLLVGGKDTQSILDFKMPIKQDLRYLFWKSNNFPNEFDGKKLEFLLIYVENSEDLNVSNVFFREMTRLKVLALVGDYRTSAQSLLQSLESLKHIQTLVMNDFELGDISMLGNLQSLETLWFIDCSIIKLPKEFMKLKKLRLLDITQCEIEMNNPFEVIEKCSQLEELTFVENVYDKEQKAAISPNVSSLTLDRYQIWSGGILDDFKGYHSLSRCFKLGGLRHLVSEAMFKNLVGTAELLSLGGYEEKIWKNLIPDIVPLDKEVMDDLIILDLYSWPDIKYLIDTKNYDSNVIAFSNLVELHLSQMDIEDLYRGSLPASFLEQLKIMTLKECQKLKNILFNGNLKLCHLMIMELRDCPQLTSIFQPSTVQTLIQLEKVIIESCDALENIISDKSSGGEIVGDDGDNDQRSCNPLFPKLKTLHVAKCHKLKIILPILFAGGLQCLERISILDCEQMKYIFDKAHDHEGDHVMLPSLREMELSEVPCLMGMSREYHKPISSHSNDNSTDKHPRSDPRAFSWWASVCCFVHKSRATSEDANIAVSKESMLDPTISQALHASKKGFETVDTTQSLLIQAWNNIRKMKLVNCSKLISLSTLSIASSMQLEDLKIVRFYQLKYIITEEDAKAHMNYCSIFPKLEKIEIEYCNQLEFLFPSTISIELKKLKSLNIKEAPELEYVVGKHHCEDHSSNGKLHFDVPALEVLYFEDVPKMISICSMNCYMASPSLQSVDIKNCGIRAFTELHGSIDGVPLFHAAQSLLIQSLNNIREIKLENCGNLMSLSTIPTASMILLEELTIKYCHKMKCIVADEVDTQVQTNYCSIFPRLKNLEIQDCEKLEFLFPSTISGGLKNLKSLTIKKVPLLKYVAGKYHQEQLLPNQNQNKELHFDFPTLENVVLEDCNIESFADCSVDSDEGQLNLNTTKGLHLSLYEVPPFQATQNLMIQSSLITIKKMKIMNCPNIISLFSLPTALTIQLEELTIKACLQLKCIVVDERDTVAHNSIFPKLKVLDVLACDALDHLFPAYAFRFPKHLELLKINDAPALKYVFGRSHHEDHISHDKQNIQIDIDFPALERLCLYDVPNLVSVYPKNYYSRMLSLNFICLGLSPEVDIRSVIDFMVYGHARQRDSTTTVGIEMQNLRDLEVYGSKIEEIFNLTHLGIEKNREGQEPLITSSLCDIKLVDLSELSNICVGPKYVLSFSSLSWLEIKRCKKLKVIFSISTLKRLPNLKNLRISECEELVHIVEEDHEENADDHWSHEPCFPELTCLNVKNCNKIKYLFSITISGIFPKLEGIYIQEAPSVEHVLIRQDETKEMTMEDVLPNLVRVGFHNLPSLVNICHGIDFRTLEENNDYYHAYPYYPSPEYNYLVLYCPRFSLYETTTAQLEVDLENIYSEIRQKTEEKLSSDESDMREAKERQGLATQQFTVDSPYLSKGAKELTSEIVEDDVILEIPNTAISSSNSKFTRQSGAKEVTRETIQEDLIPKVPKIVGHDLLQENLDSDVQVKTEEKHSSPLNTNQLDMEEANWRSNLVAQHSTIRSPKFSKGAKEATKEIVEKDIISKIIKPLDDKVVGKEVENETNIEITQQSTIGTLNFKVPIPMSHNLTVLPSKDSTPTTTKTFEEEEEGDPMLLEASMSLKQTASSTSYKPTNRRNIQSDFETTNHQTHEAMDTINISGKSRAFAIVPSGSSNVEPVPHATTIFEAIGNEGINEASVVQNKSNENTTSHGDRATVCPSNLHIIRARQIFEVRAEGVSSETLNSSSLTSKMINEGEEYSAVQESSSLERHETKNQFTDLDPRKAIPTTLVATISQDSSSMTIPIPMSSNLNTLRAGVSTSMTTKIFEEEEEEEDGLTSTRRHRSGIKAETSSHGEPFVLSPPIISSEQTAKAISPLSPLLSKTATSIKQTPSYTPSQSSYGQLVEHDVQEMYKTMDRFLIQATGSTLSPEDTHDIGFNDSATDPAPSQALEATSSSTTVGANAYSSIKGMIDISVQNMLYLEAGLKRHPQVLDWLNIKQRRAFASLFTEVTRILRTTRRGDLIEDDRNSIIECCTALKAVGFDATWLSYVYGCIASCGDGEEVRKRLKEAETKASTLRNELASVEASLVLLHEEARSLDDFIES